MRIDASRMQSRGEWRYSIERRKTRREGEVSQKCRDEDRREAQGEEGDRGKKGRVLLRRKWTWHHQIVLRHRVTRGLGVVAHRWSISTGSSYTLRRMRHLLDS